MSKFTIHFFTNFNNFLGAIFGVYCDNNKLYFGAECEQN